MTMSNQQNLREFSLKPILTSEDRLELLPCKYAGVQITDCRLDISQQYNFSMDVDFTLQSLKEMNVNELKSILTQIVETLEDENSLFGFSNASVNTMLHLSAAHVYKVESDYNSDSTQQKNSNLLAKDLVDAWNNFLKENNETLDAVKENTLKHVIREGEENDYYPEEVEFAKKLIKTGVFSEESTLEEVLIEDLDIEQDQPQEPTTNLFVDKTSEKSKSIGLLTLSLCSERSELTAFGEEVLKTKIEIVSRNGNLSISLGEYLNNKLKSFEKNFQELQNLVGDDGSFSTEDEFSAVNDFEEEFPQEIVQQQNQETKDDTEVKKQIISCIKDYMQMVNKFKFAFQSVGSKEHLQELLKEKVAEQKSILLFEVYNGGEF